MVITGTEAHMVTRTNTHMVNRVTHMERVPITAKMTITHIEIWMVVHEAARVVIKVTKMEHSGTKKVNQTVTGTNMYMVNRVIHMEMAIITSKTTIAHMGIGMVVRVTTRVLVGITHMALITTKTTIAHIGTGMVVRVTGITHMERSGTIKVNQIF